MNEDEIYQAAISSMNEKAKYKLANYMAHGYKITIPNLVGSSGVFEGGATMIERGDNVLYISSIGGVFRMERCL